MIFIYSRVFIVPDGHHPLVPLPHGLPYSWRGVFREEQGVFAGRDFSANSDCS